MCAPWTWTLVCAAVGLVYAFLVWNFDYWRKRGVPGPRPLPFVGTFPSLLTQRQHFADDLNCIYKTYKNSENFVGIFVMRTPQLMILDPKMIHEVLTTAFKHFEDNDIASLIDKKKDPLIACNPFIQNGELWRQHRALVSPGMTSSRIKVAYAVMQAVCRQFCDYIQLESQVASGRGINAKDLALRYTSEGIADCVLGIKANSFTADPLPISDNVKKFSEQNWVFMAYLFISGMFPSLVEVYKVKFFPTDCENFFLRLLREAFEVRLASRGDRPDFLNYLLSLKAKKNLNDDELISHTMTFLIDGLDTTATAISICLLMLAREPDCQARLREEIATNSDDNGELSFESLNELPYLDACIHESLRIFPPGLWSSKKCTEAYEFASNTNGKRVRVNVGDTVMLPFYSIHHDPNYYDEPEKFTPERFMPQNGGLARYREKGLYLGFGAGPRTCLGMRFALVQTKAAISTIVRHFNVLNNPKTKDGNALNPKGFLVAHDGGIWLDFERRNV